MAKKRGRPKLSVDELKLRGTFRADRHADRVQDSGDVGEIRHAASSAVLAWIAGHGGREGAAFVFMFMHHDIPREIYEAARDELRADLPEWAIVLADRQFLNGGQPFEHEWEQIREDTRRQLERERR